jgi:DNA-binding NarL/FixJ family response regulator
MNKRIRVFVFEDNDERRNSLELLIHSDSRLEFSGSSHHANNACEILASVNPDVILMDIVMQGVSGTEAVKLIKKRFPSVLIIMQSSFDDDDYVFEALRNGASGYILKKADPVKLLEAIHDAAEGGAPMSPGVAARVLKFFKGFVPPQKEALDLTERERRILGLLTDGLSYKMIASELAISYHTVNSHIKSIYEKLQVNSAGEAISKALRQGLI